MRRARTRACGMPVGTFSSPAHHMATSQQTGVACTRHPPIMHIHGHETELTAYANAHHGPDGRTEQQMGAGFSYIANKLIV